MTDLAQRLRSKANDLCDPKGETMARWDQIRHQVEALKGSDLPRMNFEGLLEDFAELMVGAADEIERLTAIIENVALAIGHTTSPLLRE